MLPKMPSYSLDRALLFDLGPFSKVVHYSKNNRLPFGIHARGLFSDLQIYPHVTRCLWCLENIQSQGVNNIFIHQWMNFGKRHSFCVQTAWPRPYLLYVNKLSISEAYSRKSLTYCVLYTPQCFQGQV